MDVDSVFTAEAPSLGKSITHRRATEDAAVPESVTGKSPVTRAAIECSEALALVMLHSCSGV